jgi:hypothetical protein
MAALWLFFSAVLSNLWIYGTGLGPVALDALAQMFMRPYREWAAEHGTFRRWFIALVAIGGILWASFAAFDEQYGYTQAALKDRDHWSRVAEGERITIEGNSVWGGLKGQIADLERENATLAAKLAKAESKPARIVAVAGKGVPTDTAKSPVANGSSYFNVCPSWISDGPVSGITALHDKSGLMLQIMAHDLAAKMAVMEKENETKLAAIAHNPGNLSPGALQQQLSDERNKQFSDYHSGLFQDASALLSELLIRLKRPYPFDGSNGLTLNGYCALSTGALLNDESGLTDAARYIVSLSKQIDN